MVLLQLGISYNFRDKLEACFWSTQESVQQRQGMSNNSFCNAHKAIVAAVLEISLHLGYWLSWRVRHTWRSSCLVTLGHIIKELGLGDASLGEDLFCMVFWLLMVMYQ
jgi:hypothetical protein